MAEGRGDTIAPSPPPPQSQPQDLTPEQYFELARKLPPNLQANPEWTRYYVNGRPTQAQQDGYTMWDSYTTFGSLNAEQLFAAIRDKTETPNAHKPLRPGKDESTWRGLYVGGKAKPEQQRAWLMWLASQGGVVTPEFKDAVAQAGIAANAIPSIMQFFANVPAADLQRGTVYKIAGTNLLSVPVEGQVFLIPEDQAQQIVATSNQPGMHGSALLIQLLRITLSQVASRAIAGEAFAIAGGGAGGVAVVQSSNLCISGSCQGLLTSALTIGAFLGVNADPLAQSVAASYREKIREVLSRTGGPPQKPGDENKIGPVVISATLAKITDVVRRSSLRKYLMKGEEIIGVAEKGGDVNRNISGGIRAAEEMFKNLSRGGKDIPLPKPDIKVVELPEGGTVTFRPFSKSGPPTIDVNLPEFPTNLKLKYPLCIRY